MLTLKEPGYFDPSHSWRGADSAPLKISETDRWNIKCVVLVDSYDPLESIGTKKKNSKHLVWRHSDVMSKTRKSPKIAKIMVFRYFFKRAISKKMALFWDILSTQKAKFQIWYFSEFLVVLWPKYVVINKTTLGIHKNGQIKIFVKIPIGLCAQIW